MNCKPRLYVLHKLTYIQLNVFTFIYTIYLLFIGEKNFITTLYFKKYACYHHIAAVSTAILPYTI